MGVDTRACCMFGIEFDSLQDALNHLRVRGVITEEQAREFDRNCEVYDIGVEWQIESCYSGTSGFLGQHINNTNYHDLTMATRKVAEILGSENLKLHNFVYWY